MRPASNWFIAFWILGATNSQANTYYIDYQSGSDASSGLSTSSPWKRCPAMRGFQGAYTHVPGDKFIFKGGAVWPAETLPIAITNSGSAGNPDDYTADRSWYSGTAWAQPTMDGQLWGKTLLSCSNAANFRVNDLHFIDAGSILPNGVKGAEFSDCGDFEITSNTFAMQSWGGLYIWTSQAKVFSTIARRIIPLQWIGISKALRSSIIPSRGGFHKIYNNTFVTPVADGQAAALLEDDLRYPSPNLDVKYNIFYGFRWPFDLRSVSHTFDNNDLHFTRCVGKWAGQWVETLSDWQRLGNDLNGVNVDPQSVTPIDYHWLQPQPCLNRGANFSLGSDWVGVTRIQ